MKTSSKKYFVLAVAGAVIIGFGLFLLLNIYFEKTEVIVAKTDIKKNEKISEENITSVQYFKNSLPEGYMTEKNEVLGRTVTVERKKGDLLMQSVFQKGSDKNLQQDLKDGEVMMALSIVSTEPIADEIVRGSRICIVSTEREKEYSAQFSSNTESQHSGMIYTENSNSMNQYSENQLTGYLIDSRSLSLSENILVIDSQIIIKNLEVIDIRKAAAKKSNTIIGSSTENTYVFLKCNIKEAPIISRVTKDKDYKIFLEKS
jgi:hypothetical protein